MGAIKKILERWVVFRGGLAVFGTLARMKAYGLAGAMSKSSAKLNLSLNKPEVATSVDELGKTWVSLMPPDAQHKFKFTGSDEKTAFTEIHIKCPLRGSGDPHACYHLMNYDRTLMEKVGGQLIVLETQANSGKDHCKLAIRKAGEDISDLEKDKKAGGAHHSAQRFRSLVGGFDLLELDPDILNAVQYGIAHALGNFQGVAFVVTKAHSSLSNRNL